MPHDYWGSGRFYTFIGGFLAVSWTDVIQGILMVAALVAAIGGDSGGDHEYCRFPVTGLRFGTDPGFLSGPVAKRGQSDGTGLGRARAVVANTGIATYLPWEPGRSVQDLVAYAWAGFGAVFGPVLLCSLYWRQMTRWAALAGMLIGGLSVVIWKTGHGGLFNLYEIVPGVVLASLAIMMVTLINRPQPQSASHRFDPILESIKCQNPAASA